MGTFKFINEEIYQTIVQRAAHDERWAAYLLLLNTCLAIAENIPPTQSALEEADIEKLVVHVLEHIGLAIRGVLPGGLEEFYYYLPEAPENTANQ